MNYTQLVCTLFCLLLFGCSKNNDDAIIDISTITGSYQIYSLNVTEGILCSTNLSVEFKNDNIDCVTESGKEYCRMGPLIINSNKTVSSSLVLSEFNYRFSHPTGEVSISGNVATICLDFSGSVGQRCDDFVIEENGLDHRYTSIGGCKVSIRLKKE